MSNERDLDLDILKELLHDLQTDAPTKEARVDFVKDLTEAEAKEKLVEVMGLLHETTETMSIATVRNMAAEKAAKTGDLIISQMVKTLGSITVPDHIQIEPCDLFKREVDTKANAVIYSHTIASGISTATH